MLVYGDLRSTGCTSELVDQLREDLEALASVPEGLVRHSRLVSAFIDAGILAQGIADAELAARGMDARSPSTEAAMQLVMALASRVALSWRYGACDGFPSAALTALRVARLPDEIVRKRPEGYAFYALYPEAYLEAAARAQAGRRCVIGIRSVGTGLAAMVAAATGAPLPSTIRPSGDPYRRALSISPTLAAEWTADAMATLAIVDEGPGRSGSSFGAVVDLLEDRGIPRSRIECYPSHRGELGTIASERHRRRWSGLRRHVVDMDELLLGSDRLASWLAALVGPLRAPLEDVSGGRWRALRYARSEDWPAVFAQQERRKLLAHTTNGTWLARFAGLGRESDEVLARARALHSQGFIPEPAGVCHGFLVERWHAMPQRPVRIDMTWLGRYLAARARMAAPTGGASMRELAAMLERNVDLALGPRAAARLVPSGPQLDELEARVRRCAIDGRLHAWEWITDERGALLKADAHDHHAAHDLIGCQDIAWDIAGATIELGLTYAEQRQLMQMLAVHADVTVAPQLVAFMAPCYAAFQLGRATLALDSSDADDVRRLRAEILRYEDQLRRLVSVTSP